MGDGEHLRMRLRDRHRQADAAQDGKIDKVVADEADLLRLEAAPLQDPLEGRQLAPVPLV